MTFSYLAGLTQDPIFPWFLSWKASNFSRYQNYWYWKSRYHLARGVRKNSPSTEGDLFIRIRVATLFADRGVILDPERTPGREHLLRALRQADYRLRYLRGKANQPSEMCAEVARIEKQIRQGATLIDGYVRYPTYLYITVSPHAL